MNEEDKGQKKAEAQTEAGFPESSLASMGLNLGLAGIHSSY